MLIAIDQSFRNTAVCIFENDGELKEFKVLKSLKTKKESNYEIRIKEIVEELMDYISNFDVTNVVLEGLSMNKNSTTARPLGGLYYHMCINFINANIEYEVLPPKTVKKFAKHGNAKKDEMYEVLPDEIKDRFLKANYKKTTGLYDLTDAYFIGKAFLNSRN